MPDNRDSIPAASSSTAFEPAYLQLYRSGELQSRALLAIQKLRDCNLCARYCQVDRVSEPGKAACAVGRLARLSSATVRIPIEAPLGGMEKSGVIRFSNCNLDCQYCQDWERRGPDAGAEVNAEALAQIMIEKQSRGALNINLLSAGHVVAQVLEALVFACDRGLNIPLVFASSGYDSLEALQLLDGVVDIYSPEIKYGNNLTAEKYSHAENYVEYSHIALREMYRQVGDLIIDEDGIARRGLLVRHLLLPANQASTKQVLTFLSNEISPDTYLNLMDGYQPSHHANRFEKINRPITDSEMRQAIRCGDRCGLHRMDLHMTRPWIGL